MSIGIGCKTKSYDLETITPQVDASKHSNNVKFTVHRENPTNEQNSEPYLQEYNLDIDKCGPMVLDALHEIKYTQDLTLAFRRSCREGVCGSCAMNINGVPTLTCISPINEFTTTVDNMKTITITPLQMYAPIRDLVVDLTPYYDQYA